MFVGMRRGAMVALGAVLAWFGTFPVPSLSRAQGPEVPIPPSSRPIDEPPAPFVPKTPRTADQQRQVEALSDFVAARSLEEQKQFAESLELLEKAQRKDPDSASILRALCRVSIALGKIDQAIAYGKQVIEADPSDATTLRLLVIYYRDRKLEPASAEAVLKQALDNPKLDKKSSAYLVIRRDLGELYARSLNQVDKAADAFADVVDGLDDKAAVKFSPAQTRMILGDQPESSYGLFGDTFFLARRYDLAVRAYRRGLAYDPDDLELPIRLAEALLRGGRKAEALATLEPFLKDRPEGREPYELLGQVLTALDRKAEVVPRLEAFLKNDPKNAGLKYVLADRYKEAGRVDEANALYEGLVKGQPDPHGFSALAQSLRKEKKYEDLLKLFERALTVPQGVDSIKPQMEALCIDKEAVTAVLDAGIRLMSQEPPGLSPIGQNVLVYMANRADQPDKIIILERLALKKNPSPTGYRELWMALYRANRFDEAVEAVEEMLRKYPDEADGRNYAILSQTRIRAGKFDGALEAAEQAGKLNPNDPDAISLAALALSKLNRFEESIARYQSMIDRFGNNDEIVKQARSGLSATYVDMGDLDKGQAELEILYQKMPGDAGINNDLGYLYADRGQKLEEAEAMIRKAVEEEPDNGSFLDSLGWVLYRRGKVQEALEPLEKAAKVQGGDATILDHLGDVYFRLQQPARARESWEKAEAIMSKSTPPDKKLPDVRRKLDALKQQSLGGDRDNP